MTQTSLHDFTTEARAFVDMIDAADGSDEEPKLWQSRLSQVLCRLYAAAAALPDVEPATADLLPVSRGEPPRLADLPLDVDTYWTLGPGPVQVSTQELIEPSVGSLMDDLGDIYADVVRVLDNADTHPLADLTWQAKFDFQIHWGYHALGALRALHHAP